VPVDVDDNKQLKKYALGALSRTRTSTPTKSSFVIAQPRCDHEQGRFRSYKFPRHRSSRLRRRSDRGREAHRGVRRRSRAEQEGVQVLPGRGANKCPAIEKHTHALVAADFTPVGLEKLLEGADRRVPADGAARRERASPPCASSPTTARARRDDPGFKLVEKRATRKWKDEDTARAQFGKMPGAMTEPDLRARRRSRSSLGKKKFAQQRRRARPRREEVQRLHPGPDGRSAAASAGRTLTDFSVVPENAEVKEQYPPLRLHPVREGSYRMKIKLNDVRLSFAQCAVRAQQVQGQGEKKFSARSSSRRRTRSSRSSKRASRRSRGEVEGQGGEVFVALKAGDKLCLHDGDAKPQYEGYKGNLFLNASNKIKPLVIDGNKSPLEASSGKPYSGCYVNAVIELWAQDNKFGKRINASLMGVQFLRDGQRLSGGGVASADDFQAIPEADAPAGAPAASGGASAGSPDPFA
jgi:hypothetical protein